MKIWSQVFSKQSNVKLAFKLLSNLMKFLKKIKKIQFDFLAVMIELFIFFIRKDFNLNISAVSAALGFKLVILPFSLGSSLSTTGLKDVLQKVYCLP